MKQTDPLFTIFKQQLPLRCGFRMQFLEQLGSWPRDAAEFAVRCSLELEDPLPKGSPHSDVVVMLAKGRALTASTDWNESHTMATSFLESTESGSPRPVVTQHCFFCLHLSHRTCLWVFFFFLKREGCHLMEAIAGDKSPGTLGGDVMVGL